MKVVVIIPSRYKSTRFLGKPLAIINGKPMIQRVYERVMESNVVDDVYVATDDKRIEEVVLNFGGNSIMTSSFHNSGTDRINEAVSNLNLKKMDIVINVQGDQPLVDVRAINSLVLPLFNNANIKMTTLAFPINKINKNNPKDVKVVLDSSGFALYFSRSMIPYDRDGNSKFQIYKHLGLYAYRKHFLDIFSNLTEGKLENIEKLEQLRVMEHGYRIFVSISIYDSPEVDTPEDIELIERKLNSF